jgi:putative monooxygenase
MPEWEVRKVAVCDVPPVRRRGGEMRVLLSPRTVQATSGFFGVLTLQPGEFVSEHYHPYSEEFLFAVSGEVSVRLDGEQVIELGPGSGLMIPIGVRHRAVNVGGCEAFLVFHLSPLAPLPEFGHVDTEPLPGDGSLPIVGSAS